MTADYGYWGADLTACLMCLTQKMSSLAYLYQDGDPAFDGKLTAEQDGLKLRHMPSLWELASYLWSPVSCLVGPFQEFTSYRAFIEQKGVYERIPFTPVKAFLHWSTGFICIVIVTTSEAWGYTPEVASSGEFYYRSFWTKFWFCKVVVYTIRANSILTMSILPTTSPLPDLAT